MIKALALSSSQYRRMEAQCPHFRRVRLPYRLQPTRPQSQTGISKWSILLSLGLQSKTLRSSCTILLSVYSTQVGPSMSTRARACASILPTSSNFNINKCSNKITCITINSLNRQTWSSRDRTICTSLKLIRGNNSTQCNSRSGSNILTSMISQLLTRTSGASAFILRKAR